MHLSIWISNISPFPPFPDKPLGIWTFEYGLFKFLPHETKVVFKCPTQVLHLMVNFLYKAKSETRTFTFIKLQNLDLVDLFFWAICKQE